MADSHLLFSYGTLRLPSVQDAVFGGPVHGEDDAVMDFRLGEVHVTDPVVVAASGSAVHPGLVPSAGDRVEGTVFTLDDAQLTAADAYEVDAYVRVRVPLVSGREAWVYALADE